ncbi:MAG: VOC family protein [Fimbriimonadia bacterium]
MRRQLSYVEVHSQTPEKTLTFYADLFNVPPQGKSKDGGGIELGDGYLGVIRSPADGALPEFGVDVDDLEPFLTRLRARGVPFEEPSEIEAGGRRFLQVIFRDPDGREVSLFQPL